MTLEYVLPPDIQTFQQPCLLGVSRYLFRQRLVGAMETVGEVAIFWQFLLGILISLFRGFFLIMCLPKQNMYLIFLKFFQTKIFYLLPPLVVVSKALCKTAKHYHN